MSQSSEKQVEKLKQALSELRANRAHFSEVAFSTIIMVLLEKLRLVQTVAPQEDTITPTDDEIRLVTVMFIDIENSTEMLQLLDTEDWKVVIDAAHDQIAEVVDQWDGQIGQYLGDGVLCFFGAQNSRGEDARHAVSCALQIQSVIGQYAQQMHNLHGIDFNLRIGISTGRVVVGMIGRQTVKQELLALGPATNRAARLQGIAPAGGVLIDSATYNRIRRDYVTQAMPPVELKGFDKPIVNYTVLGRRAQPATQFTGTRVANIDLPLVGRDETLALVGHLGEQAIANRRCEVVTLVGDVGMGKSRLLQEIVEMTDSTYMPIIMSSQYETRSKSQNLLWDMLTAQCELADDMPTDLIWAQIEAYVTDMWSEPDAPTAAQAIAYLAGFDIAPPSDADITPTEWALRWFDGVAQEQPIVILVDNLQWTDTQSIDLIQQIALRLSNRTSLIIAAGRPEYAALHRKYMSGIAHHSYINLQPLVPEDTLTIIDAIFTHIERVPASLAYTINERVEGNPLFVREYLSMLFDTNVFQRTSEGKWRFNIIMLDEALTSLPPGLQAILQARLDDLPRKGRQLIQAAAISGQRFWASAVKSMLEVDDLDAMLKPLLMRGMIIKDEDSTFDDEDAYRFRHRIYRDVAYDMIPRAKREAYHDTMAMWLLERVARKTRYYPVLAEQFLHSGAYLAAMHTYLEASEVLVEQGENRAALSLIEQSLGIANKIPREEALPVVARLWAGRSQALMRLERYDEASAASQSALMLLEELSDDQLITTRIVAERMQGLAHLSLERYNDAYDAFTRAHNLLSLNATEEIAGVLLALAKLYYYQGRLDESYAYQKRAFDKAQQLQDIHLIGSSLSGLGKLAVERGQFQVALQSFDDSLQIHRTLAVLIPQATDLFRIGIVHLLTFNYGKAYEYFRDADRFFGSVGKANMLIQGYCGYALIMLGRTTQGKALIQDAIEHAPHDVNMQHTLQFVHLASLYALEDYVTVRERGLAFIQRPQISPVIKARAQRYLGLASHRLDTRDARHHLESALEAESYYGGRNLWRCYAALGECTSDIDEQDDYYKKAADLIIEMASSLRDYPDMREGFLRSAPVQDVFEHAGTVNPLTLP